MATQTFSATGFAAKVQQLRSDYKLRFETSNLYPGCEILAQDTKVEAGVEKWSYWLADESVPDGRRYIRLSNVPGTLSGDILRLRRNLPNLSDSWEIDSDTIIKVENALTPPEEDDLLDGSDCTSADIEMLPLVEVDDSKHFVKQCKY